VLAAPARAEPPAEFAYVTNYSAGTVSAYRVDPQTGALSEVAGSPFLAGPTPNDVVVDPTNRFLYVIHGDATTLSGFALDAAGALTPLPGSPFPAVASGVADLWSGAVDPSGRFLYATDALTERVRGYVIDPATGALSLMPGSGFALGNNADAMSTHPWGRFAYGGATGGSDGVSAYTIASSTGALARVTGTPVWVGQRPMGSAVDPSGRYLYVANGASDDVSSFAIHPTTGFPGFLANTAAGDFPSGVAVAPSARFVYVANGASNTISAFSLDGSTGALAAVPGAPFAGTGHPTEVAVHSTNRFLYAANRLGNSVSAWAVDAAGSLTPLAGAPFPAGPGPTAIALTNQDPLFADGFESGDLAAWSAASTGGGDLAASPAAALEGAYGLAAHVDDTVPLFVADETPQDEDRYRARFLLRTNGFDPGVAQGRLRTRVLIAFGDGPGRRLLALVLRLREGQYAVAARVRLDDGTRADTGFLPITDLAPHAIQVDWKRASAPGAGDGSFELFVDDVSVATLSGLDNDEAHMALVRLGAMSLKPGASGELRFDRFESRRYNFIWPSF
jgi:6-phosphogluconolactonase (cycloisomerase 2 family)